MSSIVEKPCLLGRLNTPQSPGEGLRVTSFDHCLNIVTVIGKCTDVFRETFLRRGEVFWSVASEDLSIEESITREENCHEGAQDFLALFKTTMRK